MTEGVATPGAGWRRADGWVGKKKGGGGKGRRSGRRAVGEIAMVDEDGPTVPQSPYGRVQAVRRARTDGSCGAYGLGVVNLRYCNVLGAAAPELRDTGDYNLVPVIFGALRTGERPRVFGTDYPTPDGTCVRDYVDVEDVADAHVRAAEALEFERLLATYNVGRGEGSSVLDVLGAVRSSLLALVRVRPPWCPAQRVAPMGAANSPRTRPRCGWPTTRANAGHGGPARWDQAWPVQRRELRSRYRGGGRCLIARWP